MAAAAAGASAIGLEDDEAAERFIMFHNVSHSDLLVAVEPVAALHGVGGSRSSGPRLTLARPKFSSFDYVASIVLRALVDGEAEGRAHYMRWASLQGVMHNIGFDFSACPRRPPPRRGGSATL